MASSAVSHSHGGQHQHQLPAAGSMMARVDRLDLVVGYLEELRHSGSGRSSTTATSTLSSSSPTTPRARPHGCRSAEELLRETKAKGSLVERIAFLEDRVLRMEEERMEMSSSMQTAESARRTMRMMMNGSGGAGAEPGSPGSGKKGKKGLKSLVKSCVRAGAKLKTKE
ncbi:uncharacterized protein LOC119298716 [Triticum dicoccoides]|uniref:uncharacterized protein LOC119298716 n=1 Tax=Triticum dicoccoides TaxID=85692 RepID=UPI000E7B8832|nr:uncharacterized protein LOC119298716 [Triticum dicoccoides]